VTSSEPCVVGIDLSSHAIDLVQLNENNDHATWHNIILTGLSAWDRTRTVPSGMKTIDWANVYLAAIEKPFGPSRLAQSVLMRIQGAILASIPFRIPVWEVTPEEWKRHLSLPRTRKPLMSDLAVIRGCEGRWSQDARDAAGIALYARDVNAAAVAAQLTG
jgi:hypothetical protein